MNMDDTTGAVQGVYCYKAKRYCTACDILGFCTGTTNCPHMIQTYATDHTEQAGDSYDRA